MQSSRMVLQLVLSSQADPVEAGDLALLLASANLRNTLAELVCVRLRLRLKGTVEPSITCCSSMISRLLGLNSSGG